MTSQLPAKTSVIILIGTALSLSACTTQPAATPMALPTSVTVTPTLTATLPPSTSPTPTAVPPTATLQPIAPPATPTEPPPTISVVPTQVASAPTPRGDGPCTYQATFLGDVTITDNTQLAPGTAFVKTWRVRNDGTCTWGSNGYALQSLAFYGGDRLGALNPIGLPGEVPPGSTIDLSVNMVAPQTPGIYRSEWMLSIVGDPDGLRWLGFGTAGTAPLYAQIVVPAPARETGSTQTYNSSAYHYRVRYPADWTAQVNTSLPTGGSNPEYVTFAPKTGGLPRVEIWALTGMPPMAGFENCVPNFVFHNLPACKMSVPAGQNPAEDIWVFQKGAAHFYIQLQYQDATSMSVFNDIITSFSFAGWLG